MLDKFSLLLLNKILSFPNKLLLFVDTFGDFPILNVKLDIYFILNFFNLFIYQIMGKEIL